MKFDKNSLECNIQETCTHSSFSIPATLDHPILSYSIRQRILYTSIHINKLHSHRFMIAQARLLPIDTTTRENAHGITSTLNAHRHRFLPKDHVTAVGYVLAVTPKAGPTRQKNFFRMERISSFMSNIIVSHSNG